MSDCLDTGVFVEIACEHNVKKANIYPGLVIQFAFSQPVPNEEGAVTVCSESNPVPPYALAALWTLYSSTVIQVTSTYFEVLIEVVHQCLFRDNHV